MKINCLSGVEFGDAVLSGFQDESNVDDSVYKEHKVEDFDDLQVEVGPTMATSLFKHITMEKKTGMLRYSTSCLYNYKNNCVIVIYVFV